MAKNVHIDQYPVIVLKSFSINSDHALIVLGLALLVLAVESSNSAIFCFNLIILSAGNVSSCQIRKITILAAVSAV